MKTITEIKNEKPEYFVCIDGVNEFESSSLTECKLFLCDFLKSLNKQDLYALDTSDCYIGMYSITID